MTLLLSSPCSCLKTDRQKKEKRKFPHILVLGTQQAASSWRLQYLRFCVTNFMEQRICISSLVRAVWRQLAGHFMSSENILAHFFKRRELFSLF